MHDRTANVIIANILQKCCSIEQVLTQAFVRKTSLLAQLLVIAITGLMYHHDEVEDRAGFRRDLLEYDSGTKPCGTVSLHQWVFR